MTQTATRFRPSLETLEDRTAPAVMKFYAGYGGSWGNPANWYDVDAGTVGRLPDATDTVYLDRYSSPLTIPQGMPAVCGSLTIHSSWDDSLTTLGTLTVAGGTASSIAAHNGTITFGTGAWWRFGGNAEWLSGSINPAGSGSDGAAIYQTAGTFTFASNGLDAADRHLGVSLVVGYDHLGNTSRATAEVLTQTVFTLLAHNAKITVSAGDAAGPSKLRLLGSDKGVKAAQGSNSYVSVEGGQVYRANNAYKFQVPPIKVWEDYESASTLWLEPGGGLEIVGSTATPLSNTTALMLGSAQVWGNPARLIMFPGSYLKANADVRGMQADIWAPNTDTQNRATTTLDAGTGAVVIGNGTAYLGALDNVNDWGFTDFVIKSATVTFNPLEYTSFTVYVNISGLASGEASRVVHQGGGVIFFGQRANFHVLHGSSINQDITLVTSDGDIQYINTVVYSDGYYWYDVHTGGSPDRLWIRNPA